MKQISCRALVTVKQTIEKPISLFGICTVSASKMVKKDKKSKTAEQKARVAAKQSKKAAQKERKGKSKGNDDSDADDVDIESVLEEYANQVSALPLEKMLGSEY